MSYRSLIRDEWRLVSVGFALCFFSSFGQTYFIGVFGGALRTEFALSNGEFGALYSAATLLSACLLLWLGRGVDRFELRAFTGFVCGGLALAGFLMATAHSVWMLFVAILLLRLTGQGLMGHIAMTSMARYFAVHRAKAISLAAIGFATGEAMFPRLAIGAVGAIGWRNVWFSISGVALFLVVPLLWWLLQGHHARHRSHLAELESASESDSSRDTSSSSRQWSRGEVLRDPVFYLLLPAAIAPPMIVTGMFFHQVRIAEMRGWSMEFYGSCFVAFAITQLIATLLAGPLADRIGARRLFPLLLLPMIGGMGVVTLHDGLAACPAYLVLTGLTVGATSTVTGAMWAETYGVRHLGAIRAMVTAIMVFSTALSPVFMGLLLDSGASVYQILVIWISYGLIATVLAKIAPV